MLLWRLPLTHDREHSKQLGWRHGRRSSRRERLAVKLQVAKSWSSDDVDISRRGCSCKTHQSKSAGRVSRDKQRSGDLGKSGEIGEAISSFVADSSSLHSLRTAFEPNGWMNKKLFENELAQVLPALRQNMPAHELGILIYDAHSTHVNRQAVAIAKWYGFLILTLPSHLSIILQPLDNFFNGAFAKEYRAAYQAAWTNNRQPRAADKVRSVINA